MKTITIKRYVRMLVAIALVATSLATANVQPARASAGTITIVSSGGASEGSGWTNTSGVISATTTVAINASEITSALAVGNLEVSAASIEINSALRWTQATQLTLTATGILNVNADIEASGSSAGLVMNSTPAYNLASGAGASIQLTGATPSLTINSQAYTVINTKSQLTSLTASSTFIALGRSIALTDTYTDSLITGAFESVFDGLGNEVSGLKIIKTASGTTNLGFFSELRGATVRNFGVTDVYIQSASTSASNNLRIGALAGSVGEATRNSGWSATAYTTTLSKTWSSGTVAAIDSGGLDQQGVFFGGGLVGSLNNGTLVMEDSHSSANISAAGTTSAAMSVGGLIGDASNYPSTGAVRLEVRRSYATGSIVEGSVSGGYYGSGGLVGVLIGASSSLIQNSFSWSSIIATSASSGGITGYAGSGSLSSVYTTYNSFGTGQATRTNFYINVTNSTWTTLPTGFSSTIWAMNVPGMPYLQNQASPQLPLYVKVIAPTDGKYSSMSYQIVNASGTAVNLSTLGLTTPTGTPQYSIDPAVANGTYSVTYVSGLSLGGANAPTYYLAPYTTPTAVTITSAATQQFVTWAPTNTSTAYTSAQLTPNTSATSSGSGAISYTVQNAGSTGCAVSSANPPVISFNAAGDCVVRATAAGTSTEASANKDVVFTFTTPQSQTVTWAPTNTQVLANASPLTPSVAATTSGTGIITYAVQSTGGTGCAVNASTGALTFSSAGTCVVRATAASNATYSSAFTDVSFTIGSTTTSLTLNLDIAVGNPIQNAPVNYETTGLQPGAGWNLILRSSPQTLAGGSIGATGGVLGSTVIPTGLEPGWHTITLSGTRLSGGLVSTTVWFEISDSGVLLASQNTEPATTPERSESALGQTGISGAGYQALAVLAIVFGLALLATRRVRRR